MPPEDRVLLAHMIEAAKHAVGFMAGRQRPELDADRMLLFAVVRAAEIIGEAASRVSADTRALHPSVPWNAIIGMRNRLVHAYFRIDTDVVWATVTREIPDILPQLQALAAGE